MPAVAYFDSSASSRKQLAAQYPNRSYPVIINDAMITIKQLAYCHIREPCNVQCWHLVLHQNNKNTLIQCGTFSRRHEGQCPSEDLFPSSRRTVSQRRHVPVVTKDSVPAKKCCRRHEGQCPSEDMFPSSRRTVSQRRHVAVVTKDGVPAKTYFRRHEGRCPAKTCLRRHEGRCPCEDMFPSYEFVYKFTN